jgi:hypothetical protein
MLNSHVEDELNHISSNNNKTEAKPTKIANHITDKIKFGNSATASSDQLIFGSVLLLTRLILEPKT